MKEDSDQGIRQYHELFDDLVSQGYTCVLVLMPHSEYWMSYHYAKHAAYRFEHVVHVIDTQLFGLGLGFLLQELCPLAMKTRSLKSLMGRVSRLAKSIAYWIVPLTPGAMKNKLWYQKMNRKACEHGRDRDSQIPVISLSHESAILSRAKTPTRALLNLKDTVRGKDRLPLKLIVEHNGLLAESRAIGYYFQNQFQDCEIVIVETSLHLGNEWGFFVGIAVLYP